MSIITYVPAPGYTTTQRGVINVGGGISFNVGAALTAGSGVITVDSSVSPQLVDALDHDPGLIRQGVTPGPVSNSDIIAPVISHSLRSDKSSPQVGDILSRGTDGIYAPSLAGSGSGTGNVTDRGAWAATTTYNVHDLVEYGGTDFLCAVAHTSGTTFDATKWTELSQYRGAWQATTVYETNDVVVQGGSLYSAKSNFTSGASFSATNWTQLTGSAGSGGPPVAYQIVSPSGGDDTANIKAAVAAVVAAGQANGSNYGEVWFDATKGPFTLSGAADTGMSGRAQIPLPIIAPTAQKFVLVLRGTQGALPHWNQSASQKAGAALVSTLTGQTYSASLGTVSIIGGPTPEQGYATDAAHGAGGVPALFNNMLIVVDGLTLIAPANPTVHGVDLAGVAQCHIKSLAVFQDLPPSGETSVPTGFTAGLRMPYQGNNAYCEVDQYSCEGFYRAILTGEHAHISAMRAVYCHTGVGVGGPQVHIAIIDHAMIEDVVDFVEYVDLTGSFPAWKSSGATFLRINVLDWEQNAGTPWTTNSHTVNDPSNLLNGEVWSNGGNPILNGAGNLRVQRLDQFGIVAPAVAPSTPITNPFGRPAMVTITGGTGVQVLVGGMTHPLTPPCAVVVASYGAINLGAYTVAPVWEWNWI